MIWLKFIDNNCHISQKYKSFNNLKPYIVGLNLTHSTLYAIHGFTLNKLYFIYGKYFISVENFVYYVFVEFVYKREKFLSWFKYGEIINNKYKAGENCQKFIFLVDY